MGPEDFLDGCSDAPNNTEGDWGSWNGNLIQKSKVSQESSEG